MALPPDPELEPVAAAKAAMASIPEFAGLNGEAKAPAPASPRSSAPLIEPLHPEQWSAVVTLGDPLKVDGVPLTQITVRRPTTEQVWRVVLAGDDEATLNLRVRAMMCGLHAEVLQALSADDGFAVAEACRPFLPRVVADMEGAAAQALGEITVQEA